MDQEGKNKFNEETPGRRWNMHGYILRYSGIHDGQPHSFFQARGRSENSFECFAGWRDIWVSKSHLLISCTQILFSLQNPDKTWSDMSDITRLYLPLGALCFVLVWPSQLTMPLKSEKRMRPTASVFTKQTKGNNSARQTWDTRTKTWIASGNSTLHASKYNVQKSQQRYILFDDVLLVEFMYLVDVPYVEVILYLLACQVELP